MVELVQAREIRRVASWVNRVPVNSLSVAQSGGSS